MKYFLYLSLLFCLACQQGNNSKTSYKYKIEGKVKARITRGEFYTGRYTEMIISDAVAYTDTIHGRNSDSIWYFNTNGSKVTLLSPYTIVEIK